jgi:ABC-type sugar transport system ATPase subunit
VHALIETLAERGVAVLMISSDLSEILHLSDRVLVMREGAIVRSLERSAASAERVMAAAAGA